MGYYSELTYANIDISKELIRDMTMALARFLLENKKIREWYGINESVLKDDNIDVDELFESLGWGLDYDNEGNVDGMYTDPSKHYYELEIFNIIAPYVEAGSYLQMQGEDGDIWRWYFDGKHCVDKGMKWDD